MKSLLTVVLFSGVVLAQAPPSIQAEWDIVQTMQAVAQQSSRLIPLVDQLTPRDWVQQGASPTYVAQWQTARQQLAALDSTAQGLAKQPERLTLALEMYFRLQTIETQLKSLTEGVRKYQNPAVADLVIAALADNSVHRDRLQVHITDLAGQKEQEFSVVDREAQRCRGQLIRQAPARTQMPTTNPVKRPAAKQ